MNSAIQIALDSWRPPVATIATLVAIALLYARGYARVHRQMPRRFARRHLAAFLEKKICCLNGGTVNYLIGYKYRR